MLDEDVAFSAWMSAWITTDGPVPPSPRDAMRIAWDAGRAYEKEQSAMASLRAFLSPPETETGRHLAYALCVCGHTREDHGKWACAGTPEGSCSSSCREYESSSGPETAAPASVAGDTASEG